MHIYVWSDPGAQKHQISWNWSYRDCLIHPVWVLGIKFWSSAKLISLNHQTVFQSWSVSFYGWLVWNHNLFCSSQQYITHRNFAGNCDLRYYRCEHREKYQRKWENGRWEKSRRHSVWDNPDSKEFVCISYSVKKVTAPLKTDSHYNLNF